MPVTRLNSILLVCVRLIDSTKGSPVPSYALPDGLIRAKPDLQMQKSRLLADLYLFAARLNTELAALSTLGPTICMGASLIEDERWLSGVH